MRLFWPDLADNQALRGLLSAMPTNLALVRRVQDWADAIAFATLVALRYSTTHVAVPGKVVFMASRQILSLLTTYRSRRVSHPIYPYKTGFTVSVRDVKSPFDNNSIQKYYILDR